MSEADLQTYPFTGRFLLGRLRDAMSAAEKDAVEALVETVEDVPSDTHILSRGQLCDRSTMLIDGFVLRVVTQNDKRYIVGIQVPGDFVDLHAFALKRLDHDIVTVGKARVGFVPHRRLARIMEENAHLARLLWFSTLLDAAIHREWIVTMEQSTAASRAAHVFCELWRRLDFVGIGGPAGIDTPLIQADLADMCGTTAIHMNRALTKLRKQGLADFRRGLLRVPDRAQLEDYANFDASYLYGEGDLALVEDLAEELR